MELPDFLEHINSRYLDNYNTVLLGGYEEPYYVAPIKDMPARIQFTRAYYRSALHELAHWCVAGKERRMLNDFGYWYVPDGRNQEQQHEFFKVEIKPQAIEWAFSIVCGVEFEVSVDNLGNQVMGESTFGENVRQQLIAYIEEGFPKQAGEIQSLLYQQSAHSALPLKEYLLSRL